MNKNILIVSHCLLNSCSKVYTNGLDYEKEMLVRKKLLHYIVENDIELIQLPCPEFIMYGSNRWGHTREQFDNPFFKEKSKEILKDFILEIKEYYQNERFNLLGVCGINGSPSCGIDYTCSSDKWYGEFSSNDNLQEVIKSVKCIDGKGVFMEVFQNMLNEEQIKLPFVALDLDNMEKVYELLKK